MKSKRSLSQKMGRTKSELNFNKNINVQKLTPKKNEVNPKTPSRSHLKNKGQSSKSGFKTSIYDRSKSALKDKSNNENLSSRKSKDNKMIGK